MRTIPSGLTVKVSDRISLAQINHGDDGRIYVYGRPVALQNPSAPVDLTYCFDYGLESDEEDSGDELTSRKVLHDMICELVGDNRHYLDEKRRGFTIWSARKVQVSEHRIMNDDYVRDKEIHRALIQFFRYKMIDFKSKRDSKSL